MNDEWQTPDDLFLALDNEFDFYQDVASTAENSKTPVFIDKEMDALSHPWTNTVWLNPPYSRGNIEKFMKKAYEESLNGCTVVALVRDDPSTGWYKDYVDGKAAEVWRLARRVRFVGATSCYPFPCAVVIYLPRKIAQDDSYSVNTLYSIWDWKSA